MPSSSNILRLVVVLCLVISLFALFADAHSHSHGHSHDHDHDHGHSHEHSHGHTHEHSHTPKKQKEKKVAPPPPAPPVDSTILGLEPGVAAIAATALIGLAPILMLAFIPVVQKKDGQATEVVNQSLLKTLVSFAVGGLLGDVFLHLLPHSLQPHSHNDGGHGHSHSHSHEEHDHGAAINIGLLVLAGMLCFFVLEKIARIQSGAGGHSHGHSHSHSHSHAHVASDKHSDDESDDSQKESKLRKRPTSSSSSKSQHKDDDNNNNNNNAESSSNADSNNNKKISGILNIIADTAHNFTDGMAIAASFLVSERVGISTTIAVLFHEIPHEIGDYAILIQSGFTKWQAMKIQVFTAIGALIGTLVALWAGGAVESMSQYILPFTAGGFIYIATVGVLPELLNEMSRDKSQNIKQAITEVIAMAIGVGMMVVIAWTE